MPIYTYQCQACDAILERRQSFSDAPLTTCEACGGGLRKVLHPVGIVFKGSGFYNTDYRGGNGAAKSDGAKSDGETPAATTDKPSDSAAAPKSDAATATKTDAAPAGAKTEAASAGAKTD